MKNQQVEYKIHCEQDLIYLLNEQGEEQTLELTFFTAIDNEISKEKYVLTEKGALIGSKKSRLMAHQLVAPADHRTIPLSAKTISRSILSGEKNNLIQLLKNSTFGATKLRL